MGSGKGAKRGASYTVLHDGITARNEPTLSDDAPAEGLLY